MEKELIINNAGFETRVALVEDGVLSELYIERGAESEIVSNIYKGRVMRVLPGMQAAFVDIGLDQAAFIYVDDVIKDFPADKTGAPPVTPEPQEDHEEESAPEDQDERPVRARIEDMLQEGQEIMVQVAKSPIGTKGARVTSRITIPGRFLVFMPTTNHVGISRRITAEEERTRLKEQIETLRKELFGYIVRTVCEGVGPEKMEYEVDFLTRVWKRAVGRFQNASAPALLHQELSATLRAVRDLFTKEVDRLVVDSKKGYQEILDFLEPNMPGLKNSVEYYDGAEPIFDAYQLEGDISRLRRKKVWLKSGGYIVIEQTEALVSIDVNTGRYVGKRDLDETILKTNLEALKEIACQLRLRDIGGIIIIDFIDMERLEDRDKVYQVLVEALKKDRSTTNVLPMSEMGLIQMTRKRTRENINRLLSEPCAYCEGEGMVLSKKSISHNIYREILRQAADMAGSRLSVKAHPDIARFLLEEENTAVLSLEKHIKKAILIHAEPALHLEGFEIVELSDTGAQRP